MEQEDDDDREQQAGSQARYPAAPPQLSDELNLEPLHKIAVATRKAVEDAGAPTSRTRRKPSSRR